MAGGRPQKHFTPEEARKARLASKKAYRERNLDEERAKSRQRTKKAACIAHKAKKKQAALATPFTSSVGTSNKTLSYNHHSSSSKSMEPVGTKEAHNTLEAGKRRIWEKIFHSPVSPDLDSYFPQRYQAHIAGVKEMGWELLLPIVSK
ncbi:hypothetical protein M422DRAFT_243070 [Sphaerobolus stellatus SS14]|nr:hypothetical protein M422DRAFT_243070 [Sphaerobolus stellatus SS14]